MRTGFTLIELLVVLVLIAISATVSTVAFRDRTAMATTKGEAIEHARALAVRSREAVSFYADSLGRVTAYPDGLVISDSAPRLRPASLDAR